MLPIASISDATNARYKVPVRTARIAKVILAFVVTLTCWLIHGAIAPPASALTQIQISDLTQEACPPEMAAGAVTSNGSARPANCFLIRGTAKNTTNKTVVDADVYGRIYDANHNSILQNRTRIGSIDTVPPGESQFELRISVPANQPAPLQLEQFKASGFGSRVKARF